MYEIAIGLLFIIFAGLMLYYIQLQEEQNKLFRIYYNHMETRIKVLEIERDNRR